MEARCSASCRRRSRSTRGPRSSSSRHASRSVTTRSSSARSRQRRSRLPIARQSRAAASPRESTAGSPSRTTTTPSSATWAGSWRSSRSRASRSAPSFPRSTRQRRSARSCEQARRELVERFALVDELLVDRLGVRRRHAPNRGGRGRARRRPLGRPARATAATGARARHSGRASTRRRGDLIAWSRHGHRRLAPALPVTVRLARFSRSRASATSRRTTSARSSRAASSRRVAAAASRSSWRGR